VKRCLSVLALALLAVGPLRADDKPAVKNKPAKPVVVPFDLLPTGHLTVMVKVEGKGPYRLIFDTGAPITLLNTKIAREAGLLKKMPKPAFSLFGSMGEVKVGTLEVGGQKAEGVAAVVMDHPTVEAFSKAFAKKVGPIDGIVGFPFFARFKMTVDYQAKTLTFVPNGYDPPNVMKAVEAFVMKMALSGSNPPAPTVLAPAGLWGMAVAKASDDEEAGMTVKEVLPGSPAAVAGLKPGDRVLTIDGRWTDTLADLFAAAGHVKPGTTAPVVVKRDGKEVELKVKPMAGL
jgi:hypothetical protein